MFTILGGGFGLYGYLPALIYGCKQDVLLPEKYRASLSKRLDINVFIEEVLWCKEEFEAIKAVNGIILALRPIDQVQWLEQCLQYTNIKYLVLEKPLATTPDLALQIFRKLKYSGKVFRIGYNFRFTEWGKKLIEQFHSFNEDEEIYIAWSFLAHHFKHNLDNWKRYHSCGGGVIRFYGIHIIALLAEIGYVNVAMSYSFGSSSEEIEKWPVSFDGPNLPRCNVIIDANSTASNFSITRVKTEKNKNDIRNFANLTDPFDSEVAVDINEKMDRRVPILQEVCNSLWNHDENLYVWYENSLKLWREVEVNTSFKGMEFETSLFQMALQLHKD